MIEDGSCDREVNIGSVSDLRLWNGDNAHVEHAIVGGSGERGGEDGGKEEEEEGKGGNDGYLHVIYAAACDAFRLISYDVKRASSLQETLLMTALATLGAPST